MGFLSSLKKGNQVEALVISDHCSKVELQKLSDTGRMLVEGLGTRQYTKSGDKPILGKFEKKEKRIFLVDGDRGCTVSMTQAEGLLKLNTDPHMVAKIIDSAVLQYGFELSADKRTCAICFLLGGIIFGFLALLI